MGFKKILALLIGLLLALGVAEACCRVLHLGDPNQGAKEKVIWKEKKIKNSKTYVYEPNQTIEFIYPSNPRGYFDSDNKIKTVINDKGFRGKSVSFEKAPDTTRIAVLGDSFTLGVGLKDEDTLPSLLESKLSEVPRKIEVLNFGVDGFNTYREVEYLGQYVQRFNPDIVVINFYLNDARYSHDQKTKQKVKKAVKPMRQNSFLVNAIVKIVSKWTVHYRLIQQFQSLYSEDGVGWQSVQSSLQKAKNLSAQYNFELVVSIYPMLLKLDKNYLFQDVHQKVRSYCRSLGIKTIDLLPYFQGQQADKLWVHPLDSHPNEKAQKIAATAIGNFLKKEIL